MDAAHVASAVGNVTASVGLALAGLFAFGIAATPPGRKKTLPPVLASLAGMALVALAADEGFELHDRVGRWLWNEHKVAAPGPINHIDDVIVLGYVAAGALALLVSLPVLVRTPRFLFGMVVAGAMMAGGSAIDAFGTPESWTEIPEEALEASGAMLLALVFWREASRDGHLVKLPHARLHGIGMDPRTT
jgi:hypothetical protein